MLEIPIWRGGRAHTSLDLRDLLSYRREPLARVHQAPALLVHRTVADLRRAAPGPDENPAVRWAAITRAGDLLEAGAAASGPGLDPAEHARQVTLATGAPVTGARRAVAELAAGLRSVAEALAWQAPGGDLEAYRTRRVTHPDNKTYAWVPVGRVLGFIAPSNHPAVHLTWVLALAMGYSVAVRPGADDPVTPWQIIQALAAAGFPTDRIALLPGSHDLVPALVEACDRTVAYGGPSLAALIGRDSRVLFNGPGYSKVFVDAEALFRGAGRTESGHPDGDTAETGVPQRLTGEPAARVEQAADFLVDCILHDGGRKCTCASGVLVRGEAPGLLDAVARRLAALPLLDPLDPAARVPAWKDAVAVQETPAALVEADGLCFARPGLRRCSDPTGPDFRVEIPAPFASAAVIPAGAEPLPVLASSLAVTLVSTDRRLREACLLEPTIGKVFTGLVPPWTTEPGAPHQGRLSDFLHIAKYCPEVKLPWT